MNALQKLVETVENYGTKKQGPQANNGSETYRYDQVWTNAENTPYWMVKLFKAAQKEVYGTTEVSQLTKKGLDYRRIATDEVSIYCEFPKYNGQAVGKIRMAKLILL